ncbi:unnamed protein product [Alopecurus aequalis]
MPLRRLLRLSAAVPGGLRRSLTTAASHPPWGMMNRIVAAAPGEPSANVYLNQPPRVSNMYVPMHLVKTGPQPDPDGEIAQMVGGEIRATSGDGLLFLLYTDLRFVAPILGKQGSSRVRHPPIDVDRTHTPDITRFVFNPLTRQLSRLPDIACIPATKQVGERGGLAVPTPFCARRMNIDHETLAFGGRLWWVDVTWGAISADPFSDRPELSFVELPRGSVLPAGAQDEARRRGSPLPDAEGNVWWMQAPARYRRVGVSEGRLRYVEVSREEPFLLSSFALDADGSGWTLEHRVALSKLWADGGYPWPWLPLQEGKTPQIGLLDPLNANLVYVSVDEQAIVVVDMDRKEVIGGVYPYTGDAYCVPCVLPPWLQSSQIPSAGNKGAEENKNLADVLVRPDTL